MNNDVCNFLSGLDCGKSVKFKLSRTNWMHYEVVRRLLAILPSEVYLNLPLVCSGVPSSDGECLCHPSEGYPIPGYPESGRDLRPHSRSVIHSALKAQRTWQLLMCEHNNQVLDISAGNCCDDCVGGCKCGYRSSRSRTVHLNNRSQQTGAVSSSSYGCYTSPSLTLVYQGTFW